MRCGICGEEIDFQHTGQHCDRCNEMVCDAHTEFNLSARPDIQEGENFCTECAPAIYERYPQFAKCPICDAEYAVQCEGLGDSCEQCQHRLSIHPPPLPHKHPTLCSVCQQPMNVDSCSYGFLIVNGQTYRRLPFLPFDDGEITPRCGDCGVLAGNIHHFGCDAEICPRCQNQLISCECQKSVKKKMDWESFRVAGGDAETVSSIDVGMPRWSFEKYMIDSDGSDEDI